MKTTARRYSKLLIFFIIAVIAITTFFIYKNLSIKPEIGILQIFRSSSNISCKDCNVIFVSLDTLSANHLPCYGYHRNTAPNLCSFADNNILFKNTYSNGTWTLPSTASMLTGLYPETHGINGYSDILSNNIKTIPQILQENGYYSIFLSAHTDETIPIKNVYNRGINEYIDENQENSWSIALDSFKNSVRSGKKTFLFLHTYDTHELYLVGDVPKLYTKDLFPEIPINISQIDTQSANYFDYVEKYLENNILDSNISTVELNKFRNIISLIKTHKDNLLLLQNLLKPYEGDLWYISYLYNYRDDLDIYNPEVIEYIKALYDQRINQMDENRLKAFFEFINEPEIKKSTIIVITSDHGEEFMEHGHVSHETLYDPNLKIPLIISHPNVNKPIKITESVHSVDLTPTLLSMLNIENSIKTQGIDLTSSLLGGKIKPRLMITNGQWLNKTALRMGKWKLFTKNDSNKIVPYEMYDTSIDPEESNDILLLNLETAKEMISEWEKIMLTYKNTSPQ